MSLNSFAFPKETLNIKRSKLDLSWGHTTTMNSGKLVPVYVQEVLPGSTFKIDFNHVTRMMSPVAPIFGNIVQDVHFFFVPNRLVCDYNGKKKVWERIQGENTDGYWANTEEEVMETVPIYSVGSMSVANYMGIAVDPGDVENIECNTYMFKAYTLIWNEFFRDQNLEAPKDIDTYGLVSSAGSAKEINAGYTSDIGLQNYGHSDSCLPVAKLHDYFTSCLPRPQKGEAVSIFDGIKTTVYDGVEEDIQDSINAYAPVVTGPVHYSNTSITGYGQTIVSRSGTSVAATNVGLAAGTAGVMKGITGVSNIDNNNLVFANLWADISAVTNANINTLRRNFAIQRVLERDTFGTRYREMLKAHYGTTLPDYTAQVPEHLGSYRVNLNVTQVLQTSNNTGEATAIAGNHIGSLGAFSNTAGSDKIVEKSFREFGVIIGVCIIRNEQQYSSGLPRMFSRKRRFDFYLPEFANLGEQAVLMKEISIESGVDGIEDNVFGYQPAWQEYRFRNNFVSGNFAPESGDETLQHWTLSNNFVSEVPTLSADFIHQDPDTIGNVLYQQDTKTQFFIDMFFKVTATLPMPVNPIPGGLTGAW